MLSEAKPALKPDIREAKGNPTRGQNKKQFKNEKHVSKTAFVSLKSKKSQKKLPLSVLRPKNGKTN